MGEKETDELLQLLRLREENIITMLTSVNATWLDANWLIHLFAKERLPSVALLLCETCVICLYYIFCLLWIRKHTAYYFSSSLSLALFHTFLSVRRSEPYMMIMFLSLSLSRCCSLSALHTSFNHVYLQLLSMDQIHGSHKVHMSDYVSLSGKHTEKNGAKKMTEDGNRLCLPIKNITNCHFCVSNFQRKTQ